MGHMRMFDVYILSHNTADILGINVSISHFDCASFGHFLSHKNKLQNFAYFFHRSEEWSDCFLGRNSEELEVKFTIYLNWPLIFTNHHLKINTIEITCDTSWAHAKSTLSTINRQTVTESCTWTTNFETLRKREKNKRLTPKSRPKLNRSDCCKLYLPENNQRSTATKHIQFN